MKQNEIHSITFNVDPPHAPHPVHKFLEIYPVVSEMKNSVGLLDIPIIRSFYALAKDA
jgi:hypothetical protein